MRIIYRFRNTFLGASLDGLIEENDIVEIKCSFARLLTSEDAIAGNISNLRSLYKTKDNEKMNRNHVYLLSNTRTITHYAATVLHIRIMDTIKNGKNYTR